MTRDQRPAPHPLSPSPSAAIPAATIVLLVSILALSLQNSAFARFGEGTLVLRWSQTGSLKTGLSSLVTPAPDAETPAIDPESMVLALVAPGRESWVSLTGASGSVTARRGPEGSLEARFAGIESGACRLELRHASGDVFAEWSLLVAAELTTVVHLNLARGRLEISPIHPDPFGNWIVWSQAELAVLPGYGEEAIESLDLAAAPRSFQNLDGNSLERSTRLRPLRYRIDQGLSGVQTPLGSVPPAFADEGRWLLSQRAPGTYYRAGGSVGTALRASGRFLGAYRHQSGAGSVFDASAEVQWRGFDDAGPLGVASGGLDHNKLEALETRLLAHLDRLGPGRLRLSFYATGSSRDYFLQEYAENLDHAPREDRAHLLATGAYDLTAGPSRLSLDLGFSRAFVEQGDGKAFDVFESYNRPLEVDRTPDDLYYFGDDPQTPFDDGRLHDSYLRSLKTDWLLRLDSKTGALIPDHPLRIGGEVHWTTWRYYQHLAPSKTLRGGEGSFQLASYLGYSQDGDAREDPAGHAARRPNRISLYGSQRIEIGPLQAEGGLRWERFRPGQRPIADHADVLGSNNQLDDSDLDEDPTFTGVDPRLGLHARLHTETHLWVDGGRSRQYAPYEALYYDPDFLQNQVVTSETGGGAGVIFGNPSLGPEETWSGQVGVDQRLGENLSVRITGRLSETDDTWVARQADAGADKLSFYDNRGTRRERGALLGLTYDTGESSRLRILYDLSSTETDVIEPLPLLEPLLYPNRPVESLGARQTALPYSHWIDDGIDRGFFPSALDRRHQLSASWISRIDPQTAKLIGSFLETGDFALSFHAASGRPYTQTYVRKDGTQWYDIETGNAFRPAEIVDPNDLHGERLPWTWQINAAVTQEFEVFERDVVLRIEVRNLTDHRNVRQVYTSTGDADDDGWLQSEGAADDPDASDPEFVDRYRTRIDNPLHFDDGIAARLAVTVDF